MNSSGLNVAPLNGSYIDPTVRVIVHAYAYAMAAVKPRVIRRVVTHAQARAEIEAQVFGVIRARIDAVVRGIVDARGRAVARAQVAARGVADIALESPVVRVVVSMAAAAVITHTARAVRRSPVVSASLATGTTKGRALVRRPVAMTASAQVVARLRALCRAPLNVQARADVHIDTSVIKRVRFDEPAVEAQTFIVQFENNVFLVR
jgi:hypothetical protein